MSSCASSTAVSSTSTPEPAYRHVSIFYPNVVQLSERELLCVYQHGDGLYAPNNTLGVLRSPDGGLTWEDEGDLHDRSRDDRPCSYMASFLSRMSDGTLTVSPFRIDRSDPEVRLFNDNAGLIDNDPILFTSSDGGRTWSDPQVQELPGGMNFTAAQGLVELEDGRWLATFDQWPAFVDSGAYEPRMWSCTSADRGRTWSRHDGHGRRRRGGKGVLARPRPQSCRTAASSRCCGRPT